MTSVEVEAAALLFGSSDTSSDPFSAVIGTNDGEPTSTTQTFLDYHSADSAGAGDDAAGLFPSKVSTSSHETLGEYGNWTNESSNGTYESFGNQSESATEGGAEQYSYGGQDWYEENGQWYSYDAKAATDAPDNHDTGGYRHSPNAHVQDSYATNTWEPAPSTSTGVHDGGHEAQYAYSYDPYKPAPSAIGSGVSSPPVASPTTSMYDPYQPVSYTPAYAPPPAAAASTYQPTSQPAPRFTSYAPTSIPTSSRPAAPTAVIPPLPPSPKTIAPYRPKTLNAYDPPIPATKPRYRTTYHAAAQQPISPPAGQVDPYHSPYPNLQNPQIAAAGFPTAPGVVNNTPAPPPARRGVIQTSPNSGYRSSPPPAASIPAATPVDGPWGSEVRRSVGSPPLPPASNYSHSSHSHIYNGTSHFNAEQSTSITPRVEALPITDPYEDGDPELLTHSQNMSWGQADSAVFPAEAPEIDPEGGGLQGPFSSTENIGISRSASPDKVSATKSWSYSQGGSVNSYERPASRGSSSSPISHRGLPPASNYKPGSRVSSPSPLASAKPLVDSYVPHMPPHRSGFHSYDRVTRIASPPSVVQPSHNGHPAALPNAQRASPSGPARVASPSASSVRSLTGSLGHIVDPYAPSKQEGRLPPVAQPPVANGAASMSSPAPATDPYSPSQHTGRERSETSYYGDQWTSPYRVAQESSVIPTTQLPNAYGAGQEVLLKAPTYGAYAPSPSLLGTNDPLGRTSARVPVISWGFGGKIVTCFHKLPTMSTGFDVALSSRPSTSINIEVLHNVIPESQLDIVAPSYPGPLYCDPGSPTTTSLVRTAVSQSKGKKTRVLQYLTEREDELSRGVGYLSSGTAERRQTEGKLVLVRLLRIMVENDGRLSGSPQIDSAVRAALVPRLSATLLSSSSEANVSATDLTGPYPTIGISISETSETPIATYSVQPSTLDRIQDFLLRGDRLKACQYALDEKLWAHALIISSGVNKDLWKEVVNEFLRTELGIKNEGTMGATSQSGPVSLSNGRESLRVAYSLFAGQGAASVEELVPPKLLSTRGPDMLQIPLPTIAQTTPVSPNFPSPDLTATVPAENLSSWAETAVMLLSSPMTNESSAALTALGDYLVANGWVEAAHACYLLAPQTAAMGGVASPSVRLVLIGASSPHISGKFSKDSDSIIFSEIAEFALSLVPPVKGQEPFVGLPHLQAYRLLRATYLAEFGYLQLANRYCEAIRTSSTRQTPYFNATFLHTLRDLSERLIGDPNLDKSGSWIGGKMTKPSLDSIGNWLEGRFTKFIAGDGDHPAPESTEISNQFNAEQKGHFGYYSAISSEAPSTSPSPQPSLHNPNFPPPSPPPKRSGSAMALRPTTNHHLPIDRASSAMDYTRPFGRKSSPVARTASADGFYAQSPYGGQLPNGYGGTPNQNGGSHYNGSASSDQPAPSADAGPWWSSAYTAESNEATPTASNFVHPEDNAGIGSSGFISLMDDPVMPSSSYSPTTPSGSQSIQEEDEEDLGFGNSKRSAKPTQDNPKAEPSAPEKKEAKSEGVAKPPLNSSSTGSWLSRWWKHDSTPAPVKANLGEETTFYYDAEQKRWVNKKAGGDASQPKPPPPPPSRAQTASPGRSGAAFPSGSSPAPPPPMRPASAIDLTASPPRKPPMRIRSNLVPNGSESAPTTPGPLAVPGSPLPPPNRPKSQLGVKRNIRTRYVDVFQQPAES
ncbi:hypothetical protein JAAARDRAFT_190947 [Jaapia argillacea MUCL 33604]|uniref:Protein transport protein sec16 n=1 Tax=Jaapia argillacea MUCL 33604 TaxID=933084 RepID=A0A067Q3T2_9AGAM|nr:hypothetical protein JAAARDRAFT_190947 [Jaapia argillacea MUCL 33604]